MSLISIPFPVCMAGMCHVPALAAHPHWVWVQRVGPSIPEWIWRGQNACCGRTGRRGTHRPSASRDYRCAHGTRGVLPRVSCPACIGILARAPAQMQFDVLGPRPHGMAAQDDPKYTVMSTATNAA
ncbi:hypothetical protein BD413DRAFT_165543 [Trametes elegans]|nr:hypothetical protein BD413DRAFT_165543 [Trametes elegans]